MLTSGSKTDDGILSRREQPQAESQGQFQVSTETHTVFPGQIADEVHIHLLVNGKTVGSNLADLFHDLGRIAADKE